MYVLRYGKPFRIGLTIDIELINKFNNLNPEKKIEQNTSLVSTFANQDFIKFLLSEIQNGYKLKSDSRIEIIEYDENKGHPILVELIGEYDVNLFDFENGLLWSDQPGVPEYQSLCKNYFYLYSTDVIKSIQESMTPYRKSNRQLERNVESTRHMLHEIPNEEIQKDLFHIDSQEKFEKLLALVQKYFYRITDIKKILKKSIDIEGKEKIEKKIKLQNEVKKHLAKIDSTKRFISFGKSLEEYNSNGIKHIENTLYIKPNGGLWACEYSPTPYEHSKWEQYCRLEKYLTENDYLKKGITFSLDKNCKLLRIISNKDIEYLMSQFALTKNNYLTIDFEKISKLYEGVIISEKAQFIMDNFNLINPNVKPKPFCVPGIIIFSNEILKDIKDYNYELENTSTNTISPTVALKNALNTTTTTLVKKVQAAEQFSENVEQSHNK